MKQLTQIQDKNKMKTLEQLKNLMNEKYKIQINVMNNLIEGKIESNKLNTKNQKEFYKQKIKIQI